MAGYKALNDSTKKFRRNSVIRQSCFQIICIGRNIYKTILYYISYRLFITCEDRIKTTYIIIKYERPIKFKAN